MAQQIDIYFDDNKNVMPFFGPGHFDYAVCDIEYGIGASAPTTHTKKNGTLQKNGFRMPVKSPDYGKKDWDFKKSDDEYFSMLFEISKKQTIFGGNYYGLQGGYLVWDKLNGESDQQGCELAWNSFSDRVDVVYYMWSGMMQGEYCGRNLRKALWQKGNKKLNQVRIHETEKPIMLYDYIYQTYLPEGGKVIDTHGGSMSNVLSWIKQGNISGVCIENDAKTYLKAKKRINEVMAQQELFNNVTINFHECGMRPYAFWL